MKGVAHGTVSNKFERVADATPCISGGGRIYQYCSSLPSAVTGYVPTPGFYAPLPGDPVPPTFEQCVSYNGRWALTGACG